MNKIFKQFKKEAKLDPKRKADIRAHLAHMVESSPLVQGKNARVVFGRTPAFSFFKPMPVFAGVAVLVLAGGGVSFAAEQSLPGDPLYSVKTGVNERVLAALAVSPKAKASLEADLALRRIDEASKLADGGDLNSQTETELEANFKDHSEKMNSQVAALQAEGDLDGAAEVSSHFEASLRGHDSLLGQIEVDEDHMAQIEPLREQVSSTAGAVAGLRAAIELKVAAELGGQKGAMAQGRIDAAEHAVGTLKSALDLGKGRFNIGDAAKLQTQLDAANDFLNKARAKLQINAEGDAFSLAGEGLRAAEEAGIVVNSGRRKRGRGGESGGGSQHAGTTVNSTGTATTTMTHATSTGNGSSTGVEGDEGGNGGSGGSPTSTLSGGASGSGKTTTSTSGSVDIKVDLGY